MSIERDIYGEFLRESRFDRNSFIGNFIPQKFWSDLGYESGGDLS